MAYAHVDFPASSPYALACGGTRLLSDSETVWNDQDGWATGGGISDVFPVPDYQKNISLPASVNSNKKKGRGMPDIAANADSATGYNVLVDGQWTVVGGTSAVAPLIAGLIALANQKLKRNVGFIHPKIYASNPAVFKDITVGNNITAKNGGYTAGPGLGCLHRSWCSTGEPLYVHFIELVKLPSMRIPEVAHGENKTQVHIIFPEQIVFSGSFNSVLQYHHERQRCAL